MLGVGDHPTAADLVELAGGVVADIAAMYRA
ncbi:hypothetical protein JOD54_000218 [Actinokineospora baliensis]|nr:hypothetical protein [Actinokineospora baliensis]